MTGFLGKYDTPLTMYLDDDGGKKWWVKYRTTLTGNERDALREHFGHLEPRDGGVMIIWDNPFEERREETLMLIHSWNLTDAENVVLPFDFDWETEYKPGSPPSGLRISWSRLPVPVQDHIIATIGEASAEPTSAEDAQFPEGDGGSGPVGQDAPPDDREGVEGAVLLDALRDPPGPEASERPAVA